MARAHHFRALMVGTALAMRGLGRCLLLWALTGWLSVAQAASLPTSLRGFKHEAWPIERGAPSRINSITQTNDGFLWIGSVEGLFRFDGLVFEPVRLEAAPTQRLVVSSLRATRAGELWAGLARGRGVAWFRQGALVDAQMPNPSREVNDIQEDAEGGIWVARGGRSERMLARFHRGAWTEFGVETGLPAQQVWGLHFARDGTMWVVLSQSLARRRVGETTFTVVAQGLSPRASLTEDAQGQIWVSDAQGTRALDRPPMADTFFAHPNPVGGARLLFDRQGNLWTTTWNSGVLRIQSPGQALPAPARRAGRVAALDARDGLTSDQARALFLDREGNVWIGTELGLDLIRPAAVLVEPAVPGNSPTSYRMAAARDGTVYVADAQALYVIAPGLDPVRMMGLSSPAEALCASGARGVWLFLADRVLRIEGREIQRYPKPIEGLAYGCVEDTHGRLWMPALEMGLHWMEQGRWQRWAEATPSPTLPANAMLDRDGLAVVLFRSAVPEGALPFRAVGSLESPVGGVEGLLPTGDGLLVSGARGLARIDTSAGVMLSNEVHPWAASINGLAQTPDGDTWAIGDAGIVRVRSDDLAQALRRPAAPLAVRVLDFHDGLNSFVQKAPGAQVAVGGDGRVWFLTRRNLLQLNPPGLVPNPLPPPVVVRSVQAGQQRFLPSSDLTLPAGTTTVNVAFTALSLSVPGRVKFRHRLVGFSEAWSEPDGQRQLLLSDLRPGRYRLELIASNNDGVWSEQATTLELTIPETFTQSIGFKLAVPALGVLVLYGLYLARLRHILSSLRERGEERNRERERIAREMHDTLLQSVQGLILRFQSVADRLHHDPPTREAMNQALDRAEAVVVEGRDRLQGLRRVEAGDLEAELRRLAGDLPFDEGTRVSVSVAGSPRRLQPSAFDEILCIVSEALFNAAKHAQATEVSVHADYGRQSLEIVVRDNGVGLPVASGGAVSPEGHFGLLGMRERAHRIGAQFRLEGQPGQGTRMLLRIHASVAYARDAS